MTSLRDAAQAALKELEALKSRGVWGDWNGVTDALKAALAEPVPPPEAQTEAEKMAYCAGWWDALAKARKAEPVQEPQGCDHCNHPLYAAVKCKVCGRVQEPTPPQRKPLAEWQINDLMADIDPEDRDSWSFRQGVYAAEKHHGVRK